jgi:hypothetical protein
MVLANPTHASWQTAQVLSNYAGNNKTSDEDFGGKIRKVLTKP